MNHRLRPLAHSDRERPPGSPAIIPPHVTNMARHRRSAGVGLALVKDAPGVLQLALPTIHFAAFAFGGHPKIPDAGAFTPP